MKRGRPPFDPTTCMERSPVPVESTREKYDNIQRSKGHILKILTQMRTEEEQVRAELGLRLQGDLEWGMVQNYLSV